MIMIKKYMLYASLLSICAAIHGDIVVRFEGKDGKESRRINTLLARNKVTIRFNSEMDFGSLEKLINKKISRIKVGQNITIPAQTEQAGLLESLEITRADSPTILFNVKDNHLYVIRLAPCEESQNNANRSAAIARNEVFCIQDTLPTIEEEEEEEEEKVACQAENSSLQ